MNEHEKRLRDALTSLLAHKPGTQREVLALVDVAMAGARDAVLEEAAQRVDERASDLDRRQWPDEDTATVDKYAMRIAMVEDRQRLGRDIRALKSQPARRYLEAEALREGADTEAGPLTASRKP